MMTMGTTAKAAASGMFPAVPWYWYTASPMNRAEVPMICGMM